MTDGRHARLSALFLRACELAPAERAAFLDGACGSDAGLRADVERLLAHDAAGAGAFATGAGAPADTLLRGASAWSRAAVPARIGRYEILGKLGEGGMGAVYEARQEAPRRLVAIKVLRAGAADERDLRRFAREAELLGRLQHPGIAQIFEAGTTDAEGETRPFIAMERVEGVALDDWVARERPGVERRVRLVIDVARAIHHAHERGVVHRDLKPKNVLVDGSGSPRVLDFGIARATDAGQTLGAVTDPGQLVGTLAYLSPEQASGKAEVDARCDVHALGLIAFEVLTGALPYDVRGRLVHEAVLEIRDAEPRALSQADPALGGDLETVVAKALEKDPARRYDSARAFAEDLERWLRDEPVLARPASTVYQLRRLARRHRALVGGAAAVFLALALGLAATTWQAARARAQRADALRQAQRVELLLDFLLGDVLTSVEPWEDGREVRVADLLDRAAGSLATRLATQPDLEGLIRGVLGGVYRNLGLFEKAEPHLRAALELESELHGPRAPETLRRAVDLAGLLVDRGRFPEARELALRTRAEAEAELGPRHEVALAAALVEARLRNELEDRAGAESIYRAVREERARALGPDDPDTIACELGLGAVLAATGRLAEARELLERVVRARGRTLGPDHPRTVAAQVELASMEHREGDLAGAAERLRSALATSRRTLGDEHADTLHVLNELASALHDLEGPAAAEPLLAEAAGTGRRVLGRDHPSLAEYTNNWAAALEDLGELDRARELYLESLELRRAIYGDDSGRVATALNNLGVLACRMGRYEEAEGFTRDALTRRLALPDAVPDLVAESRANLGAALYGLGRPDEAAQEYAQALAVLETLPAPDEGELAIVRHQLGWSLFRTGRGAEAERPLLDAYEAFERLGHPSLAASRTALFRFYTERGEPERAAEFAGPPPDAR